MKRQLLLCLAIVATLSVAGCATAPKTTGSGSSPFSGQTAKIEEYLQQGNYNAALIECVDLSRAQPDLRGLPELQQRVMKKLNDQRTAVAAARASMTHKRMGTDVEQRKDVPDTYGLRRSIPFPDAKIRTPDSAMQKALQRKVTLHLEKADIPTLVMTLGATEKLNMIADPSIAPNTVTIHAEQVPLAEIFSYISRNLGVAFYLGENTIWITPSAEGKDAIPMETRLYKLRKGIPAKLQSFSASGAPAQDSGAAEEDIDIIQAVKRFVPAPAGSDLLFDKKAHLLIVKNTVDNLGKVEDLIEALDVCPPQVQIEARFIGTRITDLRELGVDWVLKGRNGVIPITLNSANRTQTGIPDPGVTWPVTPSAFSPNGLNFTYTGILTSPEFSAVVHALEETGKSRTLSVPRVTTVNNRPAFIRVGTDYRYFEEYNVQSVPGNSTDGGTAYSSVLVPVGRPTLAEVGIQLSVTPSVGADMSSIDLRLAPEISDRIGFDEFSVATGGNNATNAATTNGMSVIKLPVFQRSKIDTEVIVQSGETVVMGGLIKSSEDRKKSGVPLLASLPLVGFLFAHDNIDQKQENLLIFVTATILSERGEDLIPLPPPQPGNVPAADAAKAP
jgi:type IV pilus assembly protein PilQ